MIIPDLNLLIYAYNSAAKLHLPARSWWEETLSSDKLILLPWLIISGFLRLTTNRSVLVSPLSLEDSIALVEPWLSQFNVSLIEPGTRHLQILNELGRDLSVSGRNLTDAQLAALAIEHQATIYSNDSDFQRYPGVKFVNPIQ